MEVDPLRAYVETHAAKLGWNPSGGEGAFEFIQRASYRQGWEDGRVELLCGPHRDFEPIVSDEDLCKIAIDAGHATEVPRYPYNTLWFDGDLRPAFRAVEQLVYKKLVERFI